MSHQRHRARDRGYLLLAILPLAVIVGGFVLLTTTSARAYLEEHDTRRYQTSAINDANAALAVAQARIQASAYEANQNVVMRDAVAENDPTGHVNSEGEAVKVLVVRERSEVWISRIANGWYQLDAVASFGGRRAHIRTQVRERDPFSRFSAFVNSHPIGIGGKPKGDIHANRVVQLFFQDGEYEDFVSARDGFEWLVGATPENTTFLGGSDDGHAEIAMPDVNTITSLAAHSDGALDSLLGSDDASDFDIAVTLHGDYYDIVATPKDGTDPRIAVGVSFPEAGVLYFDADIASLEGTLNERITVASTGSITLTGSIRYIDADGDPIYQNGLSSDPENEPYVPNPAYDGNAALGVVANGSILYHDDLPSTVEFNGVFFSATDRFGLPGLTFTSDGRYATGYDEDFQKDSFRRLGGIISDKRIVSTVVNSNGDVLSGFQHGASVYDERLRAEPPPHFLAIDRPVFRGYRILSGAVPGATTDGTGWKLVDTPIGAYERANTVVTP